MEKTLKDWKFELAEAIERLQSKGSHHYYGISLQMTESTAKSLKEYFNVIGTGIRSYEFDYRKCPRGLIDIVISW